MRCETPDSLTSATFVPVSQTYFDPTVFPCKIIQRGAYVKCDLNPHPGTKEMMVYSLGGVLE